MPTLPTGLVGGESGVVSWFNTLNALNNEIEALGVAALAGTITDAVEAQPTWDPIAADNGPAITSAGTSAKNAGGGTVLLPRSMNLTTRPTIPHGVDLVGLGALPGSYAKSRIELNDAGAGIDFGLDTAYLGIIGSGGGLSGGFLLDGNGIANNPMRCAVGTRTYRNIEIEAALLDGLILAAVQNSLFMEVNVGSSGRDNYVFDMGAGGNHFLKCENHHAGRYFVDFRATGVGAGGVAYPLQNVIENMILEYVEASTGPMINHGAGQMNAFVFCQVVSSTGLATMATPAMIRVARDYGFTSQMLMDNCTVVATTAQAALRAVTVEALAQLYLTGVNSFSGMGILYKTASNAVVRESGEIQSAALTAPATRVEGTDAAVTRQLASRVDFTRPTTEMAFRVLQAGDTRARAEMYGSGLMWYSPGNATIDVDWGRKGVGLVGTSGKVVATGGIGVGNSAAATTPGSVVRKMEVFSAAGVSLGFVPIYSTIT